MPRHLDQDRGHRSSVRTTIRCIMVEKTCIARLGGNRTMIGNQAPPPHHSGAWPLAGRPPSIWQHGPSHPTQNQNTKFAAYNGPSFAVSFLLYKMVQPLLLRFVCLIERSIHCGLVPKQNKIWNVFRSQATKQRMDHFMKQNEKQRMDHFMKQAFAL